MICKLSDYTNKPEDVIFTILTPQEAEEYSRNRFGTFTEYRAKDFDGNFMEEWVLVTVTGKNGFGRLCPNSEASFMLDQLLFDLGISDVYPNQKTVETPSVEKKEESNIAIKQRPMPQKEVPKLDKCYDRDLVSLVDEHNLQIYELFSEINTLKLQILRLQNTIRENVKNVD